MYSASDIKDLRQRTGAGFLDCKNSLVEAKGNIDEAVDLLRKKGLASVLKKAGRISAEGVIAVALSDDNKKAAAVELNSETDFVARNEQFIEFASQLAKKALSDKDSDLSDDALSTLAARLGENIKIGRIFHLEADATSASSQIVVYVHSQATAGVGQIVSLVAIDGDDKDQARKIAMQVASQKPQWLNIDSVPAETISHEKEILTQQIKEDPKQSSKPDEIIAKMVEGRIRKFFEESCLLEQGFILEPSSKVRDNLNNLKILNFKRIEVGEGVEKKSGDFADEVKNQLKANSSTG